MILFSIQIPCTIERKAMLESLIGYLSQQIESCSAKDQFEILIEMDNYEKTTGYKRQTLLERSKGEYVISIDSDDWIPEYYIKELLRAAKSNADCFALNGTMIEGRSAIAFRISKEYHSSDFDGRIHYLSILPITAVKRKIAIQSRFPDSNRAQDESWAAGLLPLLRTECEIVPSMYYYWHTPKSRNYRELIRPRGLTDKT